MSASISTKTAESDINKRFEKFTFENYSKHNSTDCLNKLTDNNNFIDYENYKENLNSNEVIIETIGENGSLGDKITSRNNYHSSEITDNSDLDNSIDIPNKLNFLNYKKKNQMCQMLMFMMNSRL